MGGRWRRGAATPAARRGPGGGCGTSPRRLSPPWVAPGPCGPPALCSPPAPRWAVGLPLSPTPVVGRSGAPGRPPLVRAGGPLRGIRQERGRGLDSRLGAGHLTSGPPSPQDHGHLRDMATYLEAVVTSGPRSPQSHGHLAQGP